MAKTCCPHCGKRFNVKLEHAGREVPCKACGNKFTIELLSEEVPAAQPEDAKPAIPTTATTTGPTEPANVQPVTVVPVQHVPVAQIVSSTSEPTGPAAQPPIPVASVAASNPAVPVARQAAPIVAGNVSHVPAVPASTASPASPATTINSSAQSSSAYEQLSGQLMNQGSQGTATIPYDQLPYIQTTKATKNSSDVGWLGTHLVMRGSALMAFGAFLIVFALLGLSLWGLEFVQPFGAMMGSFAGLVGSCLVMGGLRSRVGTAFLAGGIPCLLFIAMGGLTGYWYQAEGWGKMTTTPSPLSNRRTSRNLDRRSTIQRNRPNSSPNQNLSRQRSNGTPPAKKRQPAFGGGATHPATNPTTRETEPKRPVEDFFKPKQPARKQDPQPRRPTMEDLQRAVKDDPRRSPSSSTDAASSMANQNKPAGNPKKLPDEDPFDVTRDQKNQAQLPTTDQRVGTEENTVADDPFAGITATPSPTAGITATPFNTFDHKLYHELVREKSSLQMRWFQSRIHRSRDLPAEIFSKRIGDEDCFGDTFTANQEQIPVLGVRMMAWQATTALGVLHPVYSRSSKHDVIAKKGYALGGISAIVDEEKIYGLQFTFMRIDGDKLDTTDQYKSGWFGEAIDGAAIESVESTGEIVFGFWLGQHLTTDAIALMLKK